MAIATVTRLSKEPEVYLVTWPLTTADPTGDAVSLPQCPDMCWQGQSAAWGSATLAAQGSNFNVEADFGAMTNVNGGAAITQTAAAAGKQSIEGPLFIRAKLTAVGSAAVITASVLCRAPKRY